MAGGQSVEAQASGEKIDSSNLGFQMMQKSGWEEGQGLGSAGGGIVNPVVANASNENAGVGTESVSK
jgi:hypothetical protein